MTNHLAAETSPYLKMHAENPVDWYPWGEEALNKAANENKPILLSIGYTACHWCHVMAHESFEDLETAKLMNDLFINIKVDREERPDLDKIYQLSAQLLTRQVGGWPLTVFLMPKSQIPFFAGTYFPIERRGDFPSFKEVLQYISMIFHQRSEQVQQQNTSFENILKELEAQGQLQAQSINSTPFKEGRQLLESNYDPVNGGFGTAPKFPMPTALQLLLLCTLTGDAKAEEMLIHSLKKMYQAGLYDQVGDGFFRYAVDANWQIPHFEKMLYDNAQLLSLLTETYAALISQKKSQKEYGWLRQAITGTADWMLREMQSNNGGFYATLSADTEGKEGKFYVWTREEIKSSLDEEEYQIANYYYGLNKPANFQHSWHLQINMTPQEVAKALNKDETEIEKILHSIKTKLHAIRSKRIYPECDEKIIVSWNGLAIKSLSLAGFYLNEKHYTDAAQKCSKFIRQNLWKNGKLYSVFKDNKAKQLANLDDHIFLMEGIIYLLQANWSTENFLFLKEILSEVLINFEDSKAGGFYFTPNDYEKLIYRVKQYTDESLPSSNAVAARILLQLGFLLGDEKLLLTAERTISNAFPHLQKYPDSYCSFLCALVFSLTPMQTIIIRAEDSANQWHNLLTKNYHPNRMSFIIKKDMELPPPLHLKEAEAETVAYICKGTECLAPIKHLQDFENELRSDQFRLTG